MQITIKRRLFISNILMIVIPVVLSLLLAVSAAALMWQQLSPETYPGNATLKMAYLARENLIAQLPELMTRPTPQLETTIQAQLAEHNLYLVLESAAGQMVERGTARPAPYEQLRAALAQLGDEGTVMTQGFQLQGLSLEVDGQNHSVLLFGPQLLPQNQPTSRLSLLLALTAVSLVILVVFGTNQLLIRFVFRAIAEPLQTLASGVHQIRDGNLEHRILYSRDDEFKPVCEDFNVMAARLSESVSQISRQEQDRKEMLAGISHDIRSPLTSIKAYAEGLRDGIVRTEADRQRYAAIIYSKASDIDQLITKLALFSRLDLDSMPMTLENIDLDREIRAYVAAIEDEYAAKGLTLEIAPTQSSAPAQPSAPTQSPAPTQSSAPPIVLKADPVFLRSILANILDNSLKYKDTDTGWVRIGYQLDGMYVNLMVEDNGPGVPDTDLERIFDPFYRCDPARTRPATGSGLGLAIVQRAVLRLGGTIKAQKAEPKGLRLVIRLPILETGAKPA